MCHFGTRYSVQATAAVSQVLEVFVCACSESVGSSDMVIEMQYVKKVKR